MSGKVYRVSLRDWNKTFVKRGRWPFNTVYVEVYETKAVVKYIASRHGKFIMWALSPLFYLVFSFIYGLNDVHDSFKEYVFDSPEAPIGGQDTVVKGSKDWDRLMTLLGETNNENQTW